MAEFKPFEVERPWGTFRQLTHNSLSTVKIHRIKPGGETSLQSHKKRSEFWHIISGSGIIRVEDKEYNVVPGDEYDAPVGVKHRWKAGDSGMILAEVAVGDFDEEDIIRFEDKYGRA
ncbi:hypothetical protein A3A05_00040 [Candidatus Nomurabacteria bacterium RIFCSPLOWO2_01_FULL_41_12]|uniref:Mannose-6-phosphate isomerase type II C-terminal domain-containing protein n=1 Tax=Candidatus Nomurabacteria bacterium RIFCSPLOWO2_01_FULL_41_12 TaxID=1801774 RepID=A0A1F6WX99_9BACT|nr:MAG: hypothetical protein A3A05_00040 [Candidatus Nomurabacteria bacterium RIFCSPLOWO2_01_FULL_41_12]